MRRRIVIVISIVLAVILGAFAAVALTRQECVDRRLSVPYMAALKASTVEALSSSVRCPLGPGYSIPASQDDRLACPIHGPLKPDDASSVPFAAAPAISDDSSAAAIADAYPAARNSAKDIEAARLVAAAAVGDDITADMLRHSGARDEIPVDWWDGHDLEPYQVVIFTAQSPADLARNGDWMHIYIMVKERSDSNWVLFRQDEGY